LHCFFSFANQNLYFMEQLIVVFVKECVILGDLLLIIEKILVYHEKVISKVKSVGEARQKFVFWELRQNNIACRVGT